MVIRGDLERENEAAAGPEDSSPGHSPQRLGSREGGARRRAADAGVPEVSLPGGPAALRRAPHVSQRHQRLLGGAG